MDARLPNVNLIILYS